MSKAEGKKHQNPSMTIIRVLPLKKKKVLSIVPKKIHSHEEQILVQSTFIFNNGI